MCLYDFISSSSLSIAYQKSQKCFGSGKLSEVNTVTGQLRKYLQQFIVRGRVMVADNIRRIIFGKIVDFDAASLYPSAQRRSYYPAGKAETLSSK